MALHIFPPTIVQPRKSSLKKSRYTDGSDSAGGLGGIAFQVNSPQSSTSIIQPGNETIKHSLFCDTAPSKSALTTRGSLRRHQSQRRSPSGSPGGALPRIDSPQLENESQFSPVPKPPSGRTSPQISLTQAPERPKLPALVSTEAQPATSTRGLPKRDTVSPSPERDRYLSPTSPSKPGLPASRPLRSSSPTPDYGDSPMSTVPPYSPGDALISTSIFPQYDHTKPLNEQQYYVRARSPTPPLPAERASQFSSSPVERTSAFGSLNSNVANSARTVVIGYEHIRVADKDDLQAVCSASCGKFSVAGRKALFHLLQSHGDNKSLSIGISQDALLYSMKKDSGSASATDAKAPEELVITKHSPGTKTSCTVAQLLLPDPEQSNKPGGNDVVSIFPQMAAINAIETVAKSTAASEITKVEPIAASPEAARNAQDAIWEAHRRNRSLLSRVSRKRESSGAVTATYKLEHPSVGCFPITVTKSTANRQSKDARAKISLHHPSATQAAVEAETLVLAFLDFAKDACVLDIPAIMALESSYIIDTVVSALMAVAVIENDALMAQSIKFDAPPKSPLPPPNRSSQASEKSCESKESKRSSKSWRRSSKKEKKKDVNEIRDDLPVLTHGALALLGLSFKAAIWTLELGAKIGVGVIVATAHAMKKA